MQMSYTIVLTASINVIGLRMTYPVLNNGSRHNEKNYLDIRYCVKYHVIPPKDFCRKFVVCADDRLFFPRNCLNIARVLDFINQNCFSELLLVIITIFLCYIRNTHCNSGVVKIV